MIIWINLPESKIRREQIEKISKHIEEQHMLIEAVDGLKLQDLNYRSKVSEELNIDKNKLNPTYYHNRKNFQSQSTNIKKILPKVGCYLSHLSALKTALDLELDSVIILEDDAVPQLDLIDSLKKYKGMDKDVVYLGGHSKKLPDKISGGFISCQNIELFGTYGYMLPSQEAIKKVYHLLKSTFNDTEKKCLKVRKASDVPMCMAIDKFYKKFLHHNSICVYPPLVKHNDDIESTIDTSKYYKKRCGNICISELINNSKTEGNDRLTSSLKNCINEVFISIE